MKESRNYGSYDNSSRERYRDDDRSNYENRRSSSNPYQGYDRSDYRSAAGSEYYGGFRSGTSGRSNANRNYDIYGDLGSNRYGTSGRSPSSGFQSGRSEMQGYGYESRGRNDDDRWRSRSYDRRDSDDNNRLWGSEVVRGSSAWDDDSYERATNQYNSGNRAWDRNRDDDDYRRDSDSGWGNNYSGRRWNDSDNDYRDRNDGRGLMDRVRDGWRRITGNDRDDDYRDRYRRDRNYDY